MTVNKITEGNIPKQLLSFFFPIFIGSLFQTLYNTVDSIIVGRFVGADALAAVGGTGLIMGLLIGFFMGLSSGGPVIISQYYGAKDYETISKAVHTTVAMAVIGGLLISVLGEIFAGPLLRLIKLDPAIIGMSTLYLRLVFAGIVFFTIYNLGGGILRAIGDSKRPRNYLILTCLMNIVLDLIFVLWLHMSVAGVAIATGISIITSSILIMRDLLTTKDIYRVEWRKIKIDWPTFKEIMRIGLPSGGTYLAYTLSNLVIQSAINSFGANTTAAFVAFGKLDNVIFMIQGAFGMSVTTFVGQNFGAKKLSRVRESTRTGMIMCVSAIAVISSAMYIFTPHLISLFAKEYEVINIGSAILHICAPFYFSYCFVEIFSGAIRGSGQAFMPMSISLITICLFRCLWVFILVPIIGRTIDNIVWCYPVSWMLAALCFTIYYLIYRKKFTVPDPA